jgi:rhamnose utilization protein RhaD (predicted bifunctional aldolase and dehydrogenase)
MKELDIKLAQIRALLDQHQLDALLLQRMGSFAWASCGAVSYINIASTIREASLFITREGCNVACQAGRSQITNNIEPVSQ